MSTFVYIKNLIRDRDIASITPTSSFGVRKVCSKIDFTKDNLFVEYGPATGVFTRYLLKRMTENSAIVCIERNADFVSILRREFPADRVKIYHDSAENVRTIVSRLSPDGADYVLSGIPFSFFDVEMRRRIVRETFDVLKPRGKFLPYQTFFQRDHHLIDHLLETFPDVKDEYFVMNVPPMRIYEAVR
ncbi:methyltransferase domain-containing protein [Paenibacillus sp. TRM 82003]|nr:methyltransferase domain-containing protein [Paenibacillus sp. TRM 82003]